MRAKQNLHAHIYKNSVKRVPTILNKASLIVKPHQGKMGIHVRYPSAIMPAGGYQNCGKLKII
jgi:hypothetical protein